MKRKKRKNNVLQLKQSYSSRLNNFKRQITYYLELLKCEGIECILDRKTIDSIFRIRNNIYPKIVVDEGVGITNKTKREIQSDFDFFLSQETISVGFTDKKLSPKGILKYLNTINTYVHFIEEEPTPRNLKFIKSYRSKITDFNEIIAKAVQEIYDIMDFFGFQITRMDQSICWLESKIQKGNVERTGYHIILKEHIPAKRTILIDKHARPIFPVSLAFTNHGVEFVSVPSDQISKNGAISNLNIQVFFQNHLFHRLEERLDCISLPLVQLSLFFNVRNHRIIEFRGKLLLEFRILDSIKLGYIIVEYIEGILLAKTFLLLTNSGTPEGEKLKHNTGMEKFDLKYWAIDKLSTFQKSDIQEHIEIRKIFDESGCEAMFGELPLSINSLQDKDISIARQLIQFMHNQT